MHILFLTKILNKTLQYNICKSEELEDSFVKAGYSFFSFVAIFSALFIFSMHLFALRFEGADRQQ